MQPVSTTNGPPTRTQTPHCPQTRMWSKDGKICSAHEDTASPEWTQSHLQFCTSRWQLHTANPGVLPYSSWEHHLTSQKGLSPKGVKLTWLHGLPCFLPSSALSVGPLNPRHGSTCSLVQARKACTQGLCQSPELQVPAHESLQRLWLSLLSLSYMTTHPCCVEATMLWMALLPHSLAASFPKSEPGLYPSS